MASAEYLAQLQALAGEFAVDFRPLVRVSDAELRALLQGAVCFAYAPRLEPFGLAPLEASALGVPIVAVAEAGVRETVVDEDTGLLVAHDPVQMGAAIGRLLADPALARRLGAGGVRWVEDRWSMAAGTDRIEAALRDVAASGG